MIYSMRIPIRRSMIGWFGHSAVRIMLAGLLSLLVFACASGYRPLPNAVYSDEDYTPFRELNPALQSQEVNLMYITDRQWDDNAKNGPDYTYHRSTTMEFGYTHLDIDPKLTWDELVDRTVSGSDDTTIPRPVFKGVTRKGHFPETPPLFIESEDGDLSYDPDWQTDFSEAAVKLQHEIASQLAMAPVKEVVISVHGIRNSLQDQATAFGLWWHLGGRQRVPIAYSWPAGKKGLLSFYAYDRESGEFKLFHLKQVLRLIAEMPGVEGIHVVGHSRGTDVAITALRELILVDRAAGRDPRQSLKLKNLILLAADLDIDVVNQRFGSEGLWTAFDRVTIYATKDRALSGAKAIFASSSRLGQTTLETVPEAFKNGRWDDRNVDFIFYEGGFGGKGISSHSYYLLPAVGADLVMLMRGHPPGAEYGRPLEEVDGHLFVMKEDYLR